MLSGRLFARISCVILLFATVPLLCASPLRAQPKTPAVPQTPEDDLAKAFGAMPIMWNLRLSPDGSRVSFLVPRSDELPAAVVYDFNSSKIYSVLASQPGIADLQWCRWANNERLLCSFMGIVNEAHVLYGATRLVGVNADGTKVKLLMQRALAEQFAQFQDRIVDYLVEDPEHVLIEVPENQSTGTARLNIYNGKLDQKSLRLEGVRGYISDGRGTPRLYKFFDGEKIRWHYRMADETKWRLLYRDHVGSDADDYQPLGFGDDPNKLLVMKPHEGRMALWSEELVADEARKRTETLISAHPEVDLDGVLTLGKYDRLVAVSYATDAGHLEFFDKDIEHLNLSVAALFPNEKVQIVDESWDRRFYIVQVSSDRNPGMIYRLDAEKRELKRIQARYPELQDRQMSQMRAIRFKARDGVKVTGYLTRPPGEKQTGLPLVVLPHGGPQSRDYWGYDWLVQYLAAKGYAVLQVNYRGSGGFGEDWVGEGGFKAWRQALDDITDGVKATVQAKISDPARICSVGWSYGGYAALMGGIEHPELYRCLVSIAGVTDLVTLKRDARKYLSGKLVADFVGNEWDVVMQGSPLRRADEIKAPVLLFHGDKDMNVYIKHSEKIASALKSAGKDFQFIRYEDAEHSIERTSWRVDLLTRIGAFLDAHTAPVPTVAAGK